MPGRIRPRLSYANVTATLALFLALGGSAFALSRNSVGSRELDRNAVKSRHLKNKQVKNKDVKPGELKSNRIANNTLREVDIQPNSLTGNVMQNDSLGGGQIDESLLDAVPLATSAGNLDGVHDMEKLSFNVPTSTATTTLLDLPGAGLQVKASCSAAGDLDLFAEATTDSGTIHVQTVNLIGATDNDTDGTANSSTADESLYTEDDDFDAGQTRTLVPNNNVGAPRDDSVQGTFTYTNNAGSIVSATYLAEEGPHGNSIEDCVVYGNVLIG